MYAPVRRPGQLVVTALEHLDHQPPWWGTWSELDQAIHARREHEQGGVTLRATVERVQTTNKVFHHRKSNDNVQDSTLVLYVTGLQGLQQKTRLQEH
jgi:phytoene dehydrogenase-like protein